LQICTLTQTANYVSIPPLSLLQAGCLSFRPTNSVKALKAPNYSENIQNAFWIRKTGKGNGTLTKFDYVEKNAWGQKKL